MSEASKNATYRLWFRFSLRYVPVTTAGHLVWETLQLPLYTIWWERGIGESAFAAGHCTVGDMLIGTTALAAAILLFGRGHAPNPRGLYAPVAAAAILLGVGYTVLSEWYNTRVDGSWAYSVFMPLVPPYGTGLSPLLQWIVVPGIAFWWLRPRQAARGAELSPSSSNETR